MSLVRLSILNAVLLAAFCLATPFWPERFWPVAQLMLLPQPVFLLPTVLLIVYGLCKGLRRVTWANGVLFLAMLLLLGEYSAAPPPLQPQSAPLLRVVSYNIRYGSGGVEALAQVIKAQDADIICLQEVIAKDEWPDPLPQLRKHFPGYAIARYGQLVTLSRFPITRSKNHPLPRNDGCGFLETQIAARGQKLFVYNAHFINPIEGKLGEWMEQIPKRARIRRDQLALLKYLVNGRSYYLIAGDFNTPPRGSLNRALLTLGQDAYAQSAMGLGYTFPAFFPVMRIDRIFSSAALEVTKSWVVASTVSDHRPLVTDFVISRMNINPMRTKFGKSLLIKAALVLVVLYSLGLTALYSSQRTFMYHPDKGEELMFEGEAKAQGLLPWRSADGKLIGWKRISTTPAKKRLLIFHGNGGNAITRVDLTEGWNKLGGWDFYFLEYPGYAWREGPPSETAIIDSAKVALEELLHKDKTPVYIAGESLGTGVACIIAASKPDAIQGLFLITPYTSTTDVAAGRLPFFPVRLMMQDRYEAAEALRGYHGPVAILLAGNDYIVPTRFGQALFDGYQGPKKIWIQPDAGHNSLDFAPELKMWREIEQFWAAKKN